MSAISSYQRLVSLVGSHQLSLICVLGLPRSNSTALHLTLTQAPEVAGQVGQPFFCTEIPGRKWDYIPSEKTPRRSLEHGCRWILNSYEYYRKSGRVGQIIFVVHELSTDIIESEFRKLNSLFDHTVYVIRDPSQVALSLLTRFVNDNLSQTGENNILSSEVFQLMESNESFNKFIRENPNKFSPNQILKLLDRRFGSRLTREDLVSSNEDFSLARNYTLLKFKLEFKNAWENLGHFWQIAQKEFDADSFSVFKGEWLFDNPKKHLQELTQRIKSITFVPEMIHDWTKSVGKGFNCYPTRNWNGAEKNSWNGPARNSTGIRKHSDAVLKKIPSEVFPTKIRDLVKDTYAIYERGFVIAPKVKFIQQKEESVKVVAGKVRPPSKCFALGVGVISFVAFLILRNSVNFLMVK